MLPSGACLRTTDVPACGSKSWTLPHDVKFALHVSTLIQPCTSSAMKTLFWYSGPSTSPL